MLGAAWIADRAVLPAITKSSNGRLVAIAARDPERARAMAAAHRAVRALATYEAVLEDPEVDAVYIPLVNSLHREWTLRALSAGKHVLCEKPLAMNAAEAEELAAASARAGRLLMEAFMYRFHPRMQRLREAAVDVRHLSAEFGFRLQAEGNYRLRPEFGGGALLDVGCYGVDIARWFLGEPDTAVAAAHVAGVDLSVSAAMGFASGSTAAVWGSFESPEHQRLTLVSDAGTTTVEQPFTAWRDPDDPYRLMVEAFAESVIQGRAAPLPVAGSVANMRVLDRIRRSFESPQAR